MTYAEEIDQETFAAKQTQLRDRLGWRFRVSVNSALV
jgi:hypothetical protein